MLVQAVKAELLKMRRSPLWILLFIIPAFTAILGSSNYANNLDVLTPGWMNLWTQHSLFLCYFFLPSIMGIVCSYLWRFEHQRNNWNLVLTQPISVSALVWGKIIVGTILYAITLFFVVVFFIVSGVFLHISAPFPADFWLWILRGLFAGVSIISLQSMLSLLIRNFAGPVAIAMALAIAGLEITVMNLGLYFPYSLLQISMNSNGTSSLSTTDTVIFVVMVLLYTIVPAIISITALKRNDVVTR